ncbi:TonB-dependent receptor [Parapedobacter tibetensis]|uniref:TonB-dependent receptor n=1 Tax=Parapedobacter tibetensis TaxID=2972951 RepID=UPI00214D658B|nr:TonB-dependent receptor [Parapedobacter tibetensis]
MEKISIGQYQGKGVRRLLMKYLIIMKLAAIFVSILCIGVQAKTDAQTVDLTLKNASLTELFAAIKQQTGYRFIYEENLLDPNWRVTLSVKQASLETVMESAVASYPLAYSIYDGTVVIKAKPHVKVVEPTVAQQNYVEGSVRDEAGQPLAGASVRVTGKQLATATNDQGKFRIAALVGDSLQFSMLGYKPLSIGVTGEQINIVMRLAEGEDLTEVVVIGYGEIRRKDITGAVGQVNMDDFAKAPVASMEDALAGRVAGVAVSSTDGQPGRLSTIVIRGAGSITQDNSPLFVIDGFPVENPDNTILNPSDIASIDILKDASATAIYGARGANGVIIITTKTGKIGTPVLSYSMNLGSQRHTKFSEMMDSYEFVRYQLEVDPARSHIYVDSTRSIDYYQTAESADFQRQLFRTGLFQNHDLSLRGGTDKTKYSLSTNLMDQNGIIIATGFKRYQGRVILEQKVNEKLNVTLNANYSETKATGAVFSEHPAGHTNSYIYNVLAYRPTRGLTSGNLVEDFFDIIDESQNPGEVLVNPITSLENEHRLNKQRNLTANGFFQYRILPYLTLKISGGITRNFRLEENFYNSRTSSGNPYRSNGVNGRVGNGNSNGWLNENTLTFSKKFAEKHKLDLLGGFTMQGSQSAGEGLSATMVPNESLGVNGLDEAPNITFSKSGSEWALASFLARANYDFDGRYLLTASIRSDGSSKFASSNRWAYFPSGALAWQMKREGFMSDIAFISESKLRISYGHSGNNRVGDFPYLSTLSFPMVSGYSFNNGAPTRGVALGALGTEKLRWETSVQTNFGYDLGLFDNRILLTAEVYRKITRDLLLNAEVPYVTGYIRSFKNMGEMRNEGLELTLNTVNIQRPNFSWSSNFNIAFNRNEVLALAENQHELLSRVSFAGSYSNGPLYVAQVGQPLAQFFGYVWDGVYQYSDFNQDDNGKYVLKDDVPNNGNPRNQIQPGDIRYRDLTGDGVVNDIDRTVLGRAIPLHAGGFSNNFTYKNVDLNVFFQWSYGNEIYNANRLIFEGNGTSTKQINQYAHYADRWTPDNPSNTLFRQGGQGPQFYSSRVLEDGSFLRLKTVSIGYHLPAGLLSRWRMSGLRLSVSAQNLYTWTNYSGPDPEVSTRNSNLTPGFDYSAYPIARTITFGLNASF